MTLPEETPQPENPQKPEENFPVEPVLPEGFTPLGDLASMPRARRRRAQRMLVPPEADERAVLLDSLARRAFPSIEFFLLSFICGIILGAAYLGDYTAFLLLGILFAPVLIPWVGMMLATVTGSWRFFFQTLGGLLVAGLLVFLTGALAGLAGRMWMPLPLSNADIHSHLWWPDMVVVALGAALLAISFVRSEQKPILPSIMLAYGLFLPLSAGGVGFGIGATPIWPDGVLVFLTYLVLAALVSIIILAILRFKPVKVSGYILPIVLGLVSLITLVIFTGWDAVIRNGINAARRVAPTPTILTLPSITPVTSRTSTPVPTLEPSATLTFTPTIELNRAFAVIAAETGGGALVRTEPGGGTVITPINNGITVEVLPEIKNAHGQVWVRIRTMNNIEGWVLQSVLTATTPTPTPTLTLTPTLTPTPKP